ncbi:MAG: hypothetical protein ACK52I_07405 [Pseudomonadota bacterium]
MAKPKEVLGWQWAERREFDGKSFGNPALYATPQTVASLVRETGQNSLDASVDGGSVWIRYRLIELAPGTERRRRFEDAMQLSSSLRSHLDGVTKSRGSQTATRIRKALEDLDSESRVLRLVVVEDYGTRGLQGGEFDSTGSFCALVRDVENSSKASETAGGSFGLGSKTLWSCSSLLTVLFSTLVVGEEEKGFRTIGKADLGFHELPNGAEHGYVGAGFFGLPYKNGGAASTWLEASNPLLEDLCLRRKPPAGAGATGTSALIVAFDDPKSDEDDSAEILRELRHAAAHNFWPAILNGSLRIVVRHEIGDTDESAVDEEIDPSSAVPSLASAFKRYLDDEQDDRLGKVGDVISVAIPHVVPATRKEGGLTPQHGELHAEARLIIRLADDDCDDRGLMDTVALVRGRSMVTQYLPRRSVAMNARAFHAILLAGTLAGDDESAQCAEVFLRHSEPPSHDKWDMWAGLKARYAHGAGAKLKDLFDSITRALQKHVVASSEPSDEGPEALKRLLVVPSTGAPKRASWRVRPGASVGVTDGGLTFAVEYDIDDPAGKRFVPKIALASEAAAEAMEIVELEIDGAPADPTGVELSAKNKRLRVSGKAKPRLGGMVLERCAVVVGALVSGGI